MTVEELAAEIDAQEKLVHDLRKRMFDAYGALKPFRDERNRVLSLLRSTYVAAQLDPDIFQPRNDWHDGMVVVAFGLGLRQVESTCFCGRTQDRQSEYRTEPRWVGRITGQHERVVLWGELKGLCVEWGALAEAKRLAVVELKIAERIRDGLYKQLERQRKKAKRP